ncbi:MAG: IPT/TIG domain-containing protein [Niabella sp.]
MKKYLLYIITLIAVSGSVFTHTGCTKNEIVVPSNVKAVPDSGIRGQFFYFTGQNLGNIVAIDFGGIKAAYLNSTYNTDSVLFCNVPSGAKFGWNDVVLKNSDSSTVTVQFKVIQPKPYIKSISPISGVSGDEITVTGTNFANISSITLGGVEITDYTIDSESQIRFTVPDGVSSGQLVIVTDGGTAQISFGEILLTDFDGNGVCPTWDAYSRGSSYIGSITASYTNATPDPVSGLFVKLSVVNPESSGWVGFNPRASTYTTPLELTASADKIYFSFDANPGDYSSTTKIRVTITANSADGTAVSTVYTKYMSVNWTGWQTTTIQLSTIGYGYGSATPVAGTTMIDPTTITKVDFAQVGTSGAVSELNLDNIKFIQEP